MASERIGFFGWIGAIDRAKLVSCDTMSLRGSFGLGGCNGGGNGAGILDFRAEVLFLIPEGMFAVPRFLQSRLPLS